MKTELFPTEDILEQNDNVMFDRLKNFRASKEFKKACIALSLNKQPSPTKSFETH